MSDKSDNLKKNLIQAMENALGIVSTACEMADVSRNTYYRYYKEDEAFKKEIDDICNVALDFAESKLFSRIKGYEHAEDKVFNDNGTPMIVPTIKHYPPDPTSIIFYLKCKGKKRGYVEKTEVDTTTRTIVVEPKNET